MDYVEVGKILNTHGLKGEVKISSHSDFNRFEVGKELYIKINDELIKVTVKSHRFFKDLDLVVFKDYEDINLIEKYKGCKLVIPKDLLEDLDDDEYYYCDLIGLECYTKDEKYIGKCVSIREVPQGEILEIEKENGKISLVPFVDEFIVSVDDKIVIKEIEGLL